MTIINLPRLLSSSQDPICTQGSGWTAPCPWGDSTAPQIVAAPTRVCAFPGSQGLTRPLPHTLTGYAQICPFSSQGSRFEGERLPRKALARLR